MPGTENETVTYKGEGKFPVYTQACDLKATIGTVKSTLRIPPQHYVVVPIKIMWTYY